jgi:AraC-like DNA-binding protein
MHTVLQHLYIAGSASGLLLGLFFAIGLSRPRGNATTTNRLLGSIFAAFACSIIANAMLHNVPAQAYPYIKTFAEPFILLVGPLFYCYIHSISGTVLRGRRWYVHFLPFFIVAIYAMLLPGNIEPSTINHRYLALINGAVGFAIYAQLWVYYVLNRRLLRAYTEQLKQSCSSIEKITQAWIAYVLAALLVCYTFVGLVHWRSHTDLDLRVNQILALLLSGFVYVLAYRMLRQPEIFAALPDTKYQKSGLADVAVAEEFNRLEKLMLDEKPYRDAELNLQGLAEQLQLSPHHLSQVINHGSRSNFYEFVNEYRTREVQRLIADPSNDRSTLLGLAYRAGFNSKATFNRFFKKATGKTPTQYRRELSR